MLILELQKVGRNIYSSKQIKMNISKNQLTETCNINWVQRNIIATGSEKYSYLSVLNNKCFVLLFVMLGFA